MIFQVEKLLLILIRITAFMVSIPGISYKGIPNILKIGISGVLAVFIYSIVPDVLVTDMFSFGLLVIKEAVLGIALGFIGQMVFSTIEIAGKLVDFQVGFAMGAIYDPAMGAQASNYGRMYYWLGLMIFFILDMQQILIKTILDSFTLIPLGTANIQGVGIEAVLSLFSKVFEIGVNLAAPMIITVLVTDMVLGIISRAVPQINVFMMGMPMKSMISFFIFLISINWIMKTSGNIIGTMPEYIYGFIKLFTTP